MTKKVVAAAVTGGIESEMALPYPAAGDGGSYNVGTGTSIGDPDRG